jgi:adenylate kinase
MRLIFLGPPGSGKGTQAQLLAGRRGLEHIATGDLLRAAIRQDTPVGQRAKPFYDAGRLVPDDMVNDLIAERFGRPDRPSKFVMDGYPRTVAQAEVFDGILGRVDLGLSAVVLLDVADEEIVRRIGQRSSCPNPTCKANYGESKPPKVPGVCDRCGTALVQRADDRPETVRARLQVYRRETVELVPYYRAKDLLREVPAVGDIEKVYADILKVV